MGVFFGGFLAAGGLVVSSSNGNCGVRRGKLMKKIVDWEWVIETHPDFDEDIDDLIHADSIEKINHYLALVDDPVEVAIQKMEWNEEGNLLSRTYFYVNFSDKTFESSAYERGGVPVRFQKELKTINQPKVIYEPT